MKSRAEYQREWRRKNPDKFKSYQDKYIKNNRKKKSEYNKEYRKRPHVKSRINKRAKIYRANNPQKVSIWKASFNKQQKERRKQLKLIVLKRYGLKCFCCGEDNLLLLTIDHPKGDGNIERKSLGINGGWKFYLWLINNNLPDGYRTACFNCNIGMFLNKGICPHKTNLKH